MSWSDAEELPSWPRGAISITTSEWVEKDMPMPRPATPQTNGASHTGVAGDEHGDKAEHTDDDQSQADQRQRPAHTALRVVRLDPRAGRPGDRRGCQRDARARRCLAAQLDQAKRHKRIDAEEGHV